MHFVLPPTYIIKSRHSFPRKGDNKPVADAPTKPEDESQEPIIKFKEPLSKGKAAERVLSTQDENKNESSEEPHRVYLGSYALEHSLTPPRIPARASSREQILPASEKRRPTDGNMQRPQRKTNMANRDRSLNAVTWVVISRLHKHWSHHCTACARTQESKTRLKKPVKKPRVSVDEATETTVRPTAMYHRSLSWINKQEDQTI